MENGNEPLPYYMQGLLLPWSWKKKESCIPLDVEEFALSSEKSAPPLRDQPPPPFRPKPAATKREGKNLIESFIDFREWLNAPSPPKPEPAPRPETPRRKVKPFDLQDIPPAMERIGWPMSAKVMRKWFSGELNYAATDDGARRGINQDGNPFPDAMIDTTMFKLDWILKYPRAKEKYDELVSVGLYSQAAKDAIIRIFKRSKPSPHYRDAWRLSGGDMHRYHRGFQFQLTRVDSDFPDKFSMFVRGTAIKNGLFMDDLYGSLGAFTLNIAVGEHYFYPRNGGRGRVEIHNATVYMRDVFTFHDRDSTYLHGLIRSGSQYLGHWNKTGFIIVPGAALAGEATAWDWPMFPVARDGMITERNVYYPVRNKDYRDWQLKHKQGGDLVLYSDRKWLGFGAPLVVEFDL
ncbi:DUF6402 family protein [Cupriavidus basilensis]|uniref:DUF6402 family protein n=1 Tax=Cupriavidus basilensis TaxID=68895 RepID=UPI000AC1C6D4|nr:DUF6402 family protein [Cupriavidus basilensis]